VTVFCATWSAVPYLTMPQRQRNEVAARQVARSRSFRSRAGEFATDCTRGQEIAPTNSREQQRRGPPGWRHGVPVTTTHQQRWTSVYTSDCWRLTCWFNDDAPRAATRYVTPRRSIIFSSRRRVDSTTLIGQTRRSACGPLPATGSSPSVRWSGRASHLAGLYVTPSSYPASSSSPPRLSVSRICALVVVKLQRSECPWSRLPVMSLHRTQ